MVRRFGFFLAAWALALLHPFSVFAGGSETGALSVTASVVDECSLTVVDHINFGGYVSGQTFWLFEGGAASVQCGRGTAFSLTFGAGNNSTGTQRRVSDGNGHYLNYSLFWGRCSGNDFAHPMEIGLGYAVPMESDEWNQDLCGQLPGGQEAPAGFYEDSVLVTTSW